MRIYFVLLLSVLAAPVFSEVGKTAVPLIDGMTITTGEGVAGPISVRVQSIGPGFCASRISVGDHSVEILAPPFDWSDWIEVTSTFASMNLKVSKTALCDTDILGEIRYFPLLE